MVAVETETSRKILYVEDNAANAVLVRKILRNIEDLEVICADSGEEGLRIVYETSPDLVLLDINLPGIGGYDVLRTLRSDPAFSNTPVVAMTASASREDLAAGLKAGFDDYLTKPFDLRHFLRIVDTHLGVKVAV
jgi:CheY-like chemotaxis protein